MKQPADRLEVASRWLTSLAFLIAIFSLIAAPILALSWRNQPFPGFTTDPTLIVTGMEGAGWTGREAGLDWPEHLVRVAGSPVRTHSDLNAVMSAHQVGDLVSIFTEMPDGTAVLHPSVRLMAFPAGDFVAQFWLPYLIGITYLALGFWIYRISGRTRAGRALSFFCIMTAITNGLTFALVTTAVLAPLFVLALALTGGALFSLGMRFPVEWQRVKQWPWLLAIPYLLAILLGLWGTSNLFNLQNPWAEETSRQTIYLFVAISVIFFLVSNAVRARTGATLLVRQQARLILAASFLAFLPITLWFLAPNVGFDLAFNSVWLQPPLLLFPIAMAVAILRYELVRVDRLVNRALIYGLLTALLAGLFGTLSGILERIFVALTGEESDAVLVITTIIIVAFVDRTKDLAKRIVDRQFAEEPDTTAPLRAFGTSVSSFLQFSDPEQIGGRLLAEAAQSLNAGSAALSLVRDGQLEPTFVYGAWRGNAVVSAPLRYQGRRYGVLFLGPKSGGAGYSANEVRALSAVVDEVAHAVHVSGIMHTHDPGADGHAHGAARLGDAGEGDHEHPPPRPAVAPPLS